MRNNFVRTLSMCVANKHSEGELISYQSWIFMEQLRGFIYCTLDGALPRSQCMQTKQTKSHLLQMGSAQLHT